MTILCVINIVILEIEFEFLNPRYALFQGHKIPTFNQMPNVISKKCQNC